MKWVGIKLVVHEMLGILNTCEIKQLLQDEGKQDHLEIDLILCSLHLKDKLKIMSLQHL